MKYLLRQTDECSRSLSASPQKYLYAAKTPADRYARFHRRLTGDCCRLVEKILPPLIIRSSHQAHDVAAGVKVEGARLAHQLHPCFGWELIALAAIAGMAAGDQVFPGRRTSTRARDHVIERQLARRQHRAAILTSIAIAQQDVLPRQRAALMGNAAVLEQPDYRRQAHGYPGRMQKVSVLLFRHGHALEHQNQRPAGGANIDRLIRRIEHENGRE